MIFRGTIHPGLPRVRFDPPWRVSVDHPVNLGSELLRFGGGAIGQLRFSANKMVALDRMLCVLRVGRDLALLIG